MSEQTKTGGRNPLSGIIGFVFIVAALTGFNHWRQGSNITAQCNDQQLGEAYCSCFKGEMMSELGIQSSVPLIGRFIKSDEKWDAAQTTAFATCDATTT